MMQINKDSYILLRSCVSLQVLEVNRHDWGLICVECAQNDTSFVEDILLSHFPSLEYAKLSVTDCVAAFDRVITSCCQLKYLSYENDFTEDMVLPLTSGGHLQQLYMQSHSIYRSSY